MTGFVKGLAAGLLIGVLATLLVSSIVDNDKDLPERIAEELGCSEGADGVHLSTAARAHHDFGGPFGYSWFAATHAERILGITGCGDAGPATSYLEFSPLTKMRHVLATLDHFGAVCLVGQAVFEGKVLDGRAQLEELCSSVDGRVVVLHDSRSKEQQ